MAVLSFQRLQHSRGGSSSSLLQLLSVSELAGDTEPYARGTRPVPSTSSSPLSDEQDEAVSIGTADSESRESSEEERGESGGDGKEELESLWLLSMVP